MHKNRIIFVSKIAYKLLRFNYYDCKFNENWILFSPIFQIQLDNTKKHSTIDRLTNRCWVSTRPQQCVKAATNTTRENDDRETIIIITLPNVSVCMRVANNAGYRCMYTKSCEETDLTQFIHGQPNVSISLHVSNVIKFVARRPCTFQVYAPKQ